MDEYITKALESPEMLTLVEFIAATRFPIDTFMIDRFWNTMNDDRLIYVDDELISWMGYSAEQAKNRKMTFMKLLPSAGDSYYHYDNVEYAKFINVWLPCGNHKIYPPAPTGRGAVNTKHLLLTPDCLRSVMMRVNTTKGDQVRQYYISLEKLFKTYIKYQCEYKTNEASRLLKETELAIKAKEDQLTDAAKQLEESSARLNDAQNQLNRVGAYNQELLQYKCFINKEETLYIGSTYDHARQGLFKVSKTTNVKSRNSTHNTTHPIGDEFVIIHQVRCHNALHLEQRVKHVLQHFRPVTQREYYQIPYSLLIRAVERLAADLDTEESLANELMEALSSMKRSPLPIDWLEDMPPVFSMIEAPPPVAMLPPNATEERQPPTLEDPVKPQYYILSLRLTKEEAEAIIGEVLNELKPGPTKYKIVGDRIKIRRKCPKSKYKAAEWKSAIDGVASRLGITINKR